MRKLMALAVSIALLHIGHVLAQSTRTVTGTVTDEKGNKLSNVTIAALGSERKVIKSALTDADGHFSIQVPDRVRGLQFSFVGYEEQFVPLTGGSSALTVKLTSNASNLSEIVVVGYGTQRRKEVTGNIASVKGAAIADKPVQSFDAALGGRAAGVQITVPNGVLNNPPVFRIRGTNSISLSSYPLIVIDGVPTFTGDLSQSSAAANPLASINPADIESMDVLKDAAATAIYGSRAANGVVIITTKKGKQGKGKVTYDGWVGWTKAYRLWHLLDADQYMMIKNEGRTNMGQTQAFFPTNDPDGKPINTKWYDNVYHTGFSHGHTVNLSGANESTSYYLSAGYTKQEGIIVKNTFERKTFRFNVDHKVSRIVSLGANLNYSNEINSAPTTTGSLTGEAYNTGGLGRLALILPPNIGPYNNDGSYNTEGAAIGRMGNKVGMAYPNPAALINNSHSSTENNHIQGNLYLQIKPIQDITLRTVYGVDYLNSDNDNFRTPLNGDGYPAGEAISTLNKYKRWVWTTTGQYDHTFAEKHTLNFLAGTEQQYTTTKGFGLDRQQIIDPFFDNIQGAWVANNSNNTDGNLGQNYLVSVFGRLNYDFDKKYFVGGSFRRDGYSAFAPGRKYGNFWSASASWDVSKERFWATSGIGRVVNTFKIRGSYGTVGNISGIGDFASYSLYGARLFNGGGSLYYNQAGNKNLTWETSKKTDIGFQFGLFKNVITGEFAWYNNNIDGLIINVPQAGSTGLPGLSVPLNAGTMYNRGVEITLNATPFNKNKFSWNTSFNITFNKNLVTTLAPGLPNIKTNTSSLEESNITLPGYSVGMIYVLRTAGVDPATGKRVFVNASGQELLFDFPTRTYTLRKDGTAAAGIDPGKDKVPFANTSPKYYGGFDNTFRYGNFDLNVLMTFQGGFYVYNGTQATIRDNRFWNSSTDVLRRWQHPGDATDVPKIYYGDNISNGSANPISDNVQKGDYIKLKSVTLGYVLPSVLMQKVGISNFRVYVSAQNLALITKYKGSDPEISSNGNSNLGQGVERNSVANGRVLTVGVNVSF